MASIFQVREISAACNTWLSSREGPYYKFTDLQTYRRPYGEVK